MLGFAWVAVQGHCWGTADVGLPLPYRKNQSLLTSIRSPDFGAAGSKQRDGLKDFPAWGDGHDGEGCLGRV